MAQPYVGEIRMFAGNFPPLGWLFCDGQLLPISENETLFQLIGTRYGGDGESTFALPNLQSRVPLHFGNGPDGVNYQMAEMAGVEEVTLSTGQIPSHTHTMLATSDPGTQSSPANLVLARDTGTDLYGADSPFVNMSPQSISPVGGSQPHENCQPFLCINYIISLFGIFPSPT
ncbi:MAG TPA: tail fiber protein [Longimicrobium sp.]|nr:tail fiber protein [Longimicrobium sp.]